MPREFYVNCEICNIKFLRFGEKRTFMAKFPKDEIRCREWVKVVGNEELVYIPIEKLSSYRFVCASHFEDSDYNKQKNRLNKFAVPRKNLKAEPLSDEVLKEFPCHIADDDECHGIPYLQNLLRPTKSNTTTDENSSAEQENCQEDKVELHVIEPSDDLEQRDAGIEISDIDIKYENIERNISDIENDNENVIDNENVVDNDNDIDNDNDNSDEPYAEHLDDTMLNDDDDLIELCRACLTRDDTKPMAEELSDAFEKITGLPNNERLPNVLCDVCEQKLKESNEFRNQCIASNEWLIDKMNIKSELNNTYDQDWDAEMTYGTDLESETVIPNNIPKKINIENKRTFVKVTEDGKLIINSSSKSAAPILGDLSSFINPKKAFFERKKKRTVVRLLDKKTNKLVPVKGKVLKHIREIIANAKRPNKVKNKRVGKKSNRTPVYNDEGEIQSEDIKTKNNINTKEEKMAKQRKETDEVFYSDESDNEVDESKFKRRKSNTKGNNKVKDETTTNSDDDNEPSVIEPVKDKNEDEENYNLHDDLVFDHEILEDPQLIMSAFFMKRKLSIEEQKNNVEKRKTSSRYLRRTYKCDLCYHAFMSKALYEAHMILHTSRAGNLVCEVCQIHKPTRSTLTVHQRCHALKYHCKFCSKVYVDRVTSIDHILKMHTTTIHHCDVCSLEFRTKSSLLNHKRTKHPCDYFCKYCGYAFNTKPGLSLHLSVIHKFEEQQVTKDEKYCLKCNATFMNKEAYEKHKKVSYQHGEVVERNYFKSHKKMSKIPADRICELCGIGLSKSTYRSHLLRAHPEKYALEYSFDCSLCEICGKNIKRKNLVHHYKTIHNFIPKIHDCELCEMKFRWKKNLNKHFKIQHKEEYLNQQIKKRIEAGKSNI